MDYSSSMVGSSASRAYFPPTQMVNTRWNAQLDAVRSILGSTDFTDNMHIALARFGHDPDPSSAGTTLGTDDTSSPQITDGFAVDVGFDDASGAYLDCNAESLMGTLDALELTPPPDTDSGGVNNVMGTWTRGALVSAMSFIDATRANHPGDTSRTYEVILMTDGDWNCPDSFTQADCDGGPGETDENPTPAAATLLANGVRVHVVAFADAAAEPSLDATAMAGGTSAAIDATSPAQLSAALDGVLTEVRDSVVIPECIGGLPRVMVLMDASSSMLVGDALGATNWDKARFALAGNPMAPNPGDAGYVQPIFDRTVEVGGSTVTIEDVVHIGLIGYNLADTQQLMLQYAPCARDNIQWAMDPYTSCDAPGCTDPYSGQPDWTFKVSDTDRVPPFVQTTNSFLPACNSAGGIFGGTRCLGSTPNTFTGEGVSFLASNLMSYQASPGAFNVDGATPFVNILITDGQTSAGSTGVQGQLMTMASAGVMTYVIGFGSAGDLDVSQLNAYAVAGGTGPSAITVDPAAGGSADALSAAIAGIIAGIGLDPCCQLNDCSMTPEPALPYCGNGMADTGEACDLGAMNGTYGVACNASCTSTAGPGCGDGVINGPEVCDDGRNVGYGSCTADCSARGEACGDGIVNGPEECDDGNLTSDDGCSGTCMDETSSMAGTGAAGTGAAGTAAAGTGAAGTAAAGTGAAGTAAAGTGAAGTAAAGTGAAGTGAAGTGAAGTGAAGTGAAGVMSMAGVGAAGVAAAGTGAAGVMSMAGVGAAGSSTAGIAAAGVSPVAGAAAGSGLGVVDQGLTGRTTEDGCTCRTVGGPSRRGPSGFAWLGLLGLVLLRRRSRRVRAPRP